MTRKRILWVAAGAAALTVGVAAERSGAQGAAASVPGTYTLVQVDGRPLPVVVDTDGACREEVVSGTLTLADGAWTLETVERETCEGRAPREERDTDRGRYTLSGASVTFTDRDGRAETGAADRDGDIDVDELSSGTLDGATLTVRLREGQTVVFRR